MKNTKKREQKISPYRTVGLDKISAPYPETPSVSGKSTVAKGDLRVRGSK